MSSSKASSVPIKSDRPPKVFSTVDAFNAGYAGPNTKLLEKKSRELAGRQDDFCIICGSHAEELFPQTGVGEVHFCPRQLCRSCWHIEAGWKRDSATKRRSVKVDDGRDFVPMCCPLCWKRGWDYSSPLLGPDQPEWNDGENIDSPSKDEVLPLRQKNWEEAARTKLFAWRKPLLSLKDDMTMESDRELLQLMLKKFQKNPKRFKMFHEQSVVEATRDGQGIDIGAAFKEHCQHLMGGNWSSSEDSGEEAVEEDIAPMKRGPGRPPRKQKIRPSWYFIEEPIESPTDSPNFAVVSRNNMSETPDTGGRPKRKAARLSFASGTPIQRSTRLAEKEKQAESPVTRSLKTRASKIITLPVSLPTSPEAKKDVAESPDLHQSNRQFSSPKTHPRTVPESHRTAEPTAEQVTADTRQPEADHETHAPEYVSPPIQNGFADQEIPSQDQHTAGEPQTPLHAPPMQNIAAERPDQGYIPDLAIAEISNKYAALQQEHELLDAKYRRWRNSAVENAKVLYDQEQDLKAKKDIITESNRINKQLSSDIARLGAELALARGMVQYNPALLKQTLLRSSLTADIVERLFSNPDFIQLLQPRPANGEVLPQLPYPPVSAPDSAPRPKKRRRITAAEAANDTEAEEARQKKLSRVIAPTIKRLEKTRFGLTGPMIESIFDADTAESKRFLDSLIDFAKLPIDFNAALALIQEAQQDRKQGRVIVPQLRLSDPAWAPWDVKTAQKRFMQREGLVENETGELVKRKIKSMDEMVADAKAMREAAAREQQLQQQQQQQHQQQYLQPQPPTEITTALHSKPNPIAEGSHRLVIDTEDTAISEDGDVDPNAEHDKGDDDDDEDYEEPTAPSTGNNSATRQASSSAGDNHRRRSNAKLAPNQFQTIWERHEELRRERVEREERERQANMPPLDMSDPLQALAASMFTNGGNTATRARGRPTTQKIYASVSFTRNPRSSMNGGGQGGGAGEGDGRPDIHRSGYWPNQGYQRRESQMERESESPDRSGVSDDGDGEGEPMEVSESP